LVIRTGLSVWMLVPALMVCGLGIGCVFSPLANLATSTVGLRQMGAASGIFNTSRQVGGVLGSAAIGVLLQARLTVSLHDATVSAAGRLPAGSRPAFISTMANAVGSVTEAGTGGGCRLPPGVPASAAARICGLATSTFQHGFTDAARATLVLPAAVLAAGAVACLVTARRPRRPAEDAAPGRQPIPEPA
jgi:hypothetical protein